MAEDYFGIVGTTQAGAYRVEAVVAEGGFGVVYRAFHDAFQAPVALKCLKIPVQLDAQHQQEFLDKFKEEAALLFRLSSSIPAVVRPLHVDRLATADGRFVPFMAMEWLEGEGLDALITRRANEGLPPLGLKKVVKLLSPVARALARAHHFPGPDGPISIVHRDLKPDNIFLAKVNGEEAVKIFDFGIAKARSVATQAAGRLSQGGSMTAFTPGYGAPEQWMPKRYGQTGPWTDVFGLALTVLEAAVGRPIIDGDTAAMMGTACDEQRRPTPRTEGLEVSDDVEAVFMAALAVDPRQRFPDAGAFWDALESSLGLELSATPTLGAASSRERSEDRGDRAPVRIPGRGSPDKAAQAGEGEHPSSRRGGVSGSGRHGVGMVELEQSSGPTPELELDLGPPSKVGPRAPTPARAGRPIDEVGGRAPSSSGQRPRALDTDAKSSPSVDLGLDVTGSRRAPSASELRGGDRPRPSANATGSYARSTAGELGASSRAAAAAAVRLAPRVSEPEPVSVRVKGPLIIAAVGMALSGLDQAMLHATNASIGVGPVRLAYVGALLTVVGIVLLIKRLIVTE